MIAGLVALVVGGLTTGSLGPGGTGVPPGTGDTPPAGAAPGAEQQGGAAPESAPATKPDPGVGPAKAAPPADREVAPVDEWAPRRRPPRRPVSPAPPAPWVDRPPPPPHLGGFWGGFSYGPQGRLDRGWDAYSSGATDGSFGLLGGVDLRRIRPRLVLGAGAGWRRENASAPLLDQVNASLVVDQYLALGIARLDVFRWLAFEGTVGAGAGRARSSVGDLEGQAWSAMSRAGLAMVLRSWPGIVPDFPRFGLSAAFEGGFAAGTSYDIDGNPTGLPKNPLPQKPVSLGSINPSGPFFAFTLRAHF